METEDPNNEKKKFLSYSMLKFQPNLGPRFGLSVKIFKCWIFSIYTNFFENIEISSALDTLRIFISLLKMVMPLLKQGDQKKLTWTFSTGEFLSNQNVFRQPDDQLWSYGFYSKK